MASTSQGASSSSGASLVTEVRPEADPLPAKIGEIGYTTSQYEEMREVSLQDDHVRTAHPAERTTTRGSNPSGSGATATSASSTRSKRSILSFFSSKGARWKGIAYATFARMALLFLALVGVITAWVIVAKTLVANPEAQQNQDSTDTTGTNPGPQGMVPYPIITHVAFSIGVLFLLLFFERAIFHARAERYNFLNPTSMAANTGDAIMGLAPWNRPPLPTYAAALGSRGTGDVEDNIIAQPPPPAYGNTRGSTLLLANLLRNSLRSVPSRGSRRVSQMSQVQRTDSPSPISYDESEEATDAQRARAVEATLSRLEEGRTGGNGGRSQ
jgi:hypothetical protein